jgi:uncharacterized protein YodC (DUF2158 family)
MSNPLAPAAPPLRPGDNVRLRAGGAVMTVERVDRSVSQPYAECAWMGAHSKMHKAYVKLDALEFVPPVEPPPDSG